MEEKTLFQKSPVEPTLLQDENELSLFLNTMNSFRTDQAAKITKFQRKKFRSIQKIDKIIFIYEKKFR